jgi:hypothetical protein
MRLPIAPMIALLVLTVITLAPVVVIVSIARVSATELDSRIEDRRFGSEAGRRLGRRRRFNCDCSVAVSECCGTGRVRRSLNIEEHDTDGLFR